MLIIVLVFVVVSIVDVVLLVICTAFTFSAFEIARTRFCSVDFMPSSESVLSMSLVNLSGPCNTLFFPERISLICSDPSAISCFSVDGACNTFFASDDILSAHNAAIRTTIMETPTQTSCFFVRCARWY